MYKNIRKQQYRYIADVVNESGDIILRDVFYKYTLTHRFRLILGITGSTNGGYYFFGIHCNDKDFHMNPNKYPLKKIYNKLLKKSTPFLNKILCN